MSELACVTPELLVWARKSVNLTIEEAVKKLNRIKVPAEILRSWKDEEKQPTYAQLERLAYVVYKRPIALFFFPTPPEEKTVAQSFRSLNDEVIKTLSYKMRLLLRKAQSRQMSFMELAGKRSPVERSLLKDLKNLRVEDRVDSIRKYLGIDLSTQSQWKDPVVALQHWRKSFEKCGIFIFKDSFSDKDISGYKDDISGFCLHDEEFPIIYLNNGKSKSRQIFTLFHELAHLLSQTGGVDFRRDDYLDYLDDNNKSVEEACNRFAGEFLVPDFDFKNKISEIKDITDKQIQYFAKYYSVSREVILRKFFDFELINQEFYNKKVNEWESQSSQKGKVGGGDYYRTQLTYLSDTFVNLAFQRYSRKEITIDQFSDYVDVKVKNFEKFENAFLQGAGRQS